MTAVTQGRAGILQLLRRYVLWRVGIPWYLLVLPGRPGPGWVIPFLILPGALSAFHLPGLSLWPYRPDTYTLLNSSLGDHWGRNRGWRGFALPRLQQRSGPLVGTLVLRALWGLWHLPSSCSSQGTMEPEPASSASCGSLFHVCHQHHCAGDHLHVGLQ